MAVLQLCAGGFDFYQALDVAIELGGQIAIGAANGDFRSYFTVFLVAEKIRKPRIGLLPKSVEIAEQHHVRIAGALASDGDFLPVARESKGRNLHWFYAEVG
jgi:hypothetical protein